MARSIAGLLVAGLVLGIPLSPTPAADPSDALQLNLRSRVEAFKGSGDWQEVQLARTLAGKETAVILCDVWDNHWCTSAARRCDVLAKKMVPVLKDLRAKGVTVIHAPSDTMDFYRDAPQRKRAQEAPAVTPPKVDWKLPDAPLPIDDSDGGCDDAEAKFYKAWTRQHAVIPVEKDDYVTDKGTEVYNILKQKGIKNLLIMGVHTNMCVLNRTFAIKQMTRWGVRCVLVRDLTDSMYNPKKRPFVPHEQGTELVIRHIEKYWCPTCTSADLLAK